MIRELYERPKSFGFFQAVRLLEILARRRRGPRRPGAASASALATDPRDEAVRFRGQLSLAFAASEIAKADRGDGGSPPQLTVPFLTLAGPSGPLPSQYAALALRMVREKSTSLRDFLDLFNHRLLTLFYAVWAKYRLPVAFERRNGDARDGATSFLRSMVGIEGETLERRLTISDEVLVHFSGALARRQRPSIELQRILSDYLGRAVEMRQFVGQWLPIAEGEQTRISGSGAGAFAVLGRDTVVGQRVYDIESAFVIEIGPLTQAEFDRLLPTGEDFAAIRDLVQFHAGLDFTCTISPLLRATEAPTPILGPEPVLRLGWNAWLQSHPSPRTLTDARFALAVG